MFAEGRSPRTAVVTALIGAVLAVASCARSEADGKVVVADPSSAVRLITSEEYVVLDLRPPAAFDAGHVRGARSLPYVSAAAFETRAAELEPTAHYLVYSRRVEEADVAADQLVSLGFEHVVDGGAFGLLALAGAEVE